MGNYVGFIALFSHESSVKFILRKVKAKVFGGARLKKLDLCNFPVGLATAFTMSMCLVNLQAKKSFLRTFCGAGCAVHFGNCCSRQSVVDCFQIVSVIVYPQPHCNVPWTSFKYPCTSCGNWLI